MKLKLIDLIPNPEQPRSEIDQVELQGLAESIREHGLLNPISVEGPQADGKYIILDGERRWRAHKLAGLEEIEVHVARPALNGSGQVERLVLGLIGNLQRQDMNIIERARCYQRLHDLGMSWREVGRLTNMTASMIPANVKLLDLPVDIQDLYAQGRLPFDLRVVDAFLALDQDQAIRLANQAAIRAMTAKRILFLSHKLRNAGFEPQTKQKPRNPKQSAVAKSNPVWNAKAEFGHWNALAMLKLQGKAVTDGKIKTAAIETCQACALYEDASKNVCRDCPAVELIRRLA